KAVDKLLQENIQPVASEDANEFRSRFLYTEEVSDAFTEHITLLQELYDANMGKYCKPGEKKGMHLVEFLVLLEKYQVFCDSFRIVLRPLRMLSTRNETTLKLLRHQTLGIAVEGARQEPYNVQLSPRRVRQIRMRAAN
ncbi:hypothetical protein PI125_g27066, partial [Phytophthora idaei]